MAGRTEEPGSHRAPPSSSQPPARRRSEGFRQACESLWRVAYPEQCVLCGELLDLDTRHFCAPCREGLPWIGEHACPRCGSQVAPHAATAKGCAACRGRPFAFERAVAPFRYEGVVRDLILEFKLGKRSSLACVLGGLLCDMLAEGGLTQVVDVVVPVPLHWRRRVQRGFNQARLLALEVGARFGLPVAQGLLRRGRATQSQTGFSRLGRQANVRGAFAVRTAWVGQGRIRSLVARLLGAEDLLGRRALLIDDVMTTGSTVHECARTLREAGAAEVFVVTIARAHGS